MSSTVDDFDSNFYQEDMSDEEAEKHPHWAQISGGSSGMKFLKEDGKKISMSDQMSSINLKTDSVTGPSGNFEYGNNQHNDDKMSSYSGKSTGKNSLSATNSISFDKKSSLSKTTSFFGGGSEQNKISLTRSTSKGLTGHSTNLQMKQQKLKKPQFAIYYEVVDPTQSWAISGKKKGLIRIKFDTLSQKIKSNVKDYQESNDSILLSKDIEIMSLSPEPGSIHLPKIMLSRVYIDEYSCVHYLPERCQFDNSETSISFGKKGANLKKSKTVSVCKVGMRGHDVSGEVHFSNKFKVVPVV